MPSPRQVAIRVPKPCRHSLSRCGDGKLQGFRRSCSFQEERAPQTASERCRGSAPARVAIKTEQGPPLRGTHYGRPSAFLTAPLDRPSRTNRIEAAIGADSKPKGNSHEEHDQNQRNFPTIASSAFKRTARKPSGSRSAQPGRTRTARASIFSSRPVHSPKGRSSFVEPKPVKVEMRSEPHTDVRHSPRRKAGRTSLFSNPIFFRMRLP